MDLIGIGVNIGEQGVTKPACRHQIARSLRYRQSGKPFVGYQQGPGYAGGGTGIGDFGNPASAKANGSGVGPIGGRRGVFIRHDHSGPLW